MSKYYRVDMDDFEALPFCSDMDEGWEGHALIIEEQFKEEFVAEQVGRFTRHLLSILYAMPTREEHNPFCNLAAKYHYCSSSFGIAVECPKCGSKIGEDEWDSNTDDMRPCCPNCEYEFEMEREEE